MAKSPAQKAVQRANANAKAAKKKATKAKAQAKTLKKKNKKLKRGNSQFAKSVRRFMNKSPLLFALIVGAALIAFAVAVFFIGKVVIHVPADVAALVAAAVFATAVTLAYVVAKK